MLTVSYKEKFAKLDKEIKKLRNENESLVNRVMAGEKQLEAILEDKEKLKQRLAKIAKRGGKIDSQQKTCKKCSKEFNEKENFNWSCRTH